MQAEKPPVLSKTHTTPMIILLTLGCII